MERAVVVTDLHGQDQLFGRVVNHYGEDMTYVINGDSVDGAIGVKKLFDMFGSLDTRLNKGNHEVVLLGALLDEDPDRADAWHGVWLGGDSFNGYENLTLESYGIDRYNDHADTAKATRERLADLGHLALLEGSQMYYETSDTLAIHAGADPLHSWREQRDTLYGIHVKHRQHVFDEEPEQLTSFLWAQIAPKPKDLDKTLVTGHRHFSRHERPLEKRATQTYGRLPSRVYLASHMHGGDPLFAYETWSGKVQAFDHGGIVRG